MTQQNILGAIGLERPVLADRFEGLPENWIDQVVFHRRFWNDAFLWCVTGEVVGKGFRAGGLFDPKGAGREVEHREAEVIAFAHQPREIVVAATVERTFVEDGAGRDHARDLAFDNAFGGSRVFHLFTDRDLFARIDQLGNVAFRRMIRESAHRDVVALGQSDVENARSVFGIAQKHFIEIAETEKKDGSIGKVAADSPVLLHHRCCLFRHKLSNLTKPFSNVWNFPCHFFLTFLPSCPAIALATADGKMKYPVVGGRLRLKQKKTVVILEP